MAGGVNMRKILPVLLIIFLVFSPVSGEEENRTIDTSQWKNSSKRMIMFFVDPHNLTALEFRSLIF